MQVIWAETALTPSGWKNDVTVAIDNTGRIASVGSGTKKSGETVGVLLPSPSNVHSHAFQRAMAGMTEGRGPDPADSFWTWRKLMFRFLDNLEPDDIEAITTFVQMEMLEAGYAAVGEFHYIHHQPGGEPYDDLAELSKRVMAASNETGIGLTLLPVLYQHGGCDGRELSPGQVRFGNDFDRYAKLHEMASGEISKLPEDCIIGVAPHSLRAVRREGLASAIGLAGKTPLHMHLAEQVAEVNEVKKAWGARPVEWLLENHEVGETWCLIHCTQMQTRETTGLAKTGAVAGLCPITESSLGDGIFDGMTYLENSGRFAVGSDSNIRISLSEELRTLEYSQRLRDRGRAMVATPEKTSGRVLYDAVTENGGRAIGRDSGSIEAGKFADLVALDRNSVNLIDKQGDQLLDSFIFASDDRVITNVWSAGRHVVSSGKHENHDEICRRYRDTVLSLKERI